MVNHQNEIHSAAEKLKNLQFDYWNQYVFSWKWNLLLAILIVSWFIIVLLLRYQRVKRMEYMIFTLLVAFFSSYFDQLGVGYGLFSYPIKLVPSFSTFLPGSLGAFPAIHLMLFHYYNNHVIRFYVGVILFAATISFVVQPLLVLWNIYSINRWHYTASFLTTVFIAASARYITNKLTERSPTENTTGKIKIMEINMRWFRQKAR